MSIDDNADFIICTECMADCTSGKRGADYFYNENCDVVCSDCVTSGEAPPKTKED